ncbi:hypothetical protein BC943DRAFT_300260 [Umbelopsis sp. AD052]|nr:hypothetical protein BC943DRAFT_300260 [Umbelopsis sp. AD052]
MSFFKFSKQSDKVAYPWSQKKSSGPALPRYGHVVQAVSTTETLVVYGGVAKGSGKKDIFMFDPATGSTSSYSASGDYPPARSYHTAISFANQVLVYGGEPKNVEEATDENLYILNLGTKQWSTVRTDVRPPRGRSGHSAILHGMNMYVWGGECDGIYFNDLLHFDVNALNSGPRWRVLQPQNEGPSPRSNHVSALVNNKLYIFSGNDGRTVHNDIWCFDLNTGYWEQIAALGYIPAPRDGASAAVVDDVIYVFGGRGSDGQLLGDLCAFKVTNRRWYMFQNMGPAPTPRSGHTLTAQKDKIYVLGGEPANGMKSEDATMIYILDTTKIKYPETTQTPSSPTSARNPELSAINGGSPSPTRGLQNEASSPTTGYHPSNLAHARQSNMPPRSDSPITPQNQSFPDNRPPQSGRGNTLSLHPGNAPTGPNGRPFRHASMIPDAVLRRNRPTSPMPFVDSEPRKEVMSPPGTPGGELHPNGHGYPNGHANGNLNGREDLERRLERSDSITIDTDDLYDGLTSSPGLPPPSTPNHHSPGGPAQHPGMQRPPSRASPTTNGFANHSTPPRPSREGVDIGGQKFRNTIAIPQGGEIQLPSNGSTGIPAERRPKSHIPTPDQMRDIHSASPSPSPRTPIPMTLEHSRSESPLTIRNAVDNSMKPTTSRSHSLKDDQNTSHVSEERAHYTRELKAKDAIILEMKKKEQWWRTEVSLARKLRAKLDDEVPEDVENVLMNLDDQNSDQAKLFDQLVRLKTELRKVKLSIGHQSQGACQQVLQAEKMRTAALQEAAYFRSKYTAIQSRQADELASIETARAKELEDRLVHALSENETLQKKLQQMQKKVNHDQHARESAEDRVADANARADDAQQAHTRAVEELSNLHTRTLQAEAQVRDSTARIADLTTQLNRALATEVSPTALSDATIKISQLEASSIKLRSEVASLKQKLADSEDENEKMRTAMMEKESSLMETTRILEDNEIKLGIMKEAMIQKGFEISDVPSTSGHSESASKLQELQKDLSDLDQSTRRTIRELRESVSMWESRCRNLEGSERQASDKAKHAVAEVTRLQSELKTLAASKDATNNAELTRSKATLMELERAVTEARRNESDARLELQEASQIYESKIRQLEKENLLASDMAQTSEDALETVKKEAADTEAKLNQLSSSLEELEETNKKLTYQLKEMQDNHQVNSVERGKLEEAQAEWESERAALDNKIEQLHHNLSHIQESASGSVSKAKDLTDQLEALQDERDQLIAECNRLKGKHSEHKKEMRRAARELNLEIQSLTKQIEQTSAELEASTQTNTKLRKELDIAMKNQKSEESEKWTIERKQLEQQLQEQIGAIQSLKSERDLLKRQYQDSQRKIELLLDQMNESEDEDGRRHTNQKQAPKDDDTEYSAIESSEGESSRPGSLKYIPDPANGPRGPNIMKSINSELSHLSKWQDRSFDSSDDNDSDEEILSHKGSSSTLRQNDTTPPPPSRSPARSQVRSPARTTPVRTPVQANKVMDSSDDEEEGYDSMIHSLEAVSMKAQSITESK